MRIMQGSMNTVLDDLDSCRTDELDTIRRTNVELDFFPTFVSCRSAISEGQKVSMI